MKKSLVKIGFLETPDLYLEDIKRETVEVKGFCSADKTDALPKHFEVDIFCKKIVSKNGNAVSSSKCNTQSLGIGVF